MAEDKNYTNTPLQEDELEIDFEDIQTIGAYVILNKEIPKEADAEEEAEKVETVKVEIDDE